MELIEGLHERGRTVILVTHETYTAEYAERIIRLKDGLIESDLRVSARHHKGDRFIK
jgi:putative ABC transport system ATP-binding protein